MLKVAVDTKPQQQESNNEITKFREHIQHGIEQELLTIEDVEIVDRNKREWVYYIEVTFSLCKSSEDNSSQPLARILAQIVNDKGWVNENYDSVYAYPMDRISTICELFVELFNDICLEKVRKKKHVVE